MSVSAQLPLIPSNYAADFAPADDLILRAIYRYYYLTAAQVTRLFYSPKSIEHVRQKLRKLARLGLLQQSFIPTITGKAPSRFSLSRKGLYAVAEVGLPLPRRIDRPSEAQESYRYAKHTQAVNDVLIGLELLCRADERFQLTQLLHERDLLHQPLRVSVPASWSSKGTEERASVIPDGWVDLLVAGVGRMCLLLELDRGTEEQRKWRRKVRGLLAAALGPYQQYFNTKSLTIVVVAAPGEEHFVPTDPRRRVSNLLSWTEAELAALGQTRLADLFRFTWLLPGQTDERDAFLSPRWNRPFDHTPAALLPIKEGGTEVGGEL